MGCARDNLDVDLRTSDSLETYIVLGKMLLVVSLVMNEDLGGNERQDDCEGDADGMCDWQETIGKDESIAEALLTLDVIVELEDVVKVVEGTEELAMDVLIVVGLIEHELLDDWDDETDVMKWLFDGELLVPTRLGEMDELVDEGRLGEMAMIEE